MAAVLGAWAGRVAARHLLAEHHAEPVHVLSSVCCTSRPTLEDCNGDDMPVSDGGFAGAVTETGEYRAMGQYGTAGVVGYAAGSDFRSMVYGGRHEGA